MSKVPVLCSVLLVWLSGCAMAQEGPRAAEMAAVEGVQFGVRKERPRIFFRAEDWGGPSLPKLRRWVELPEYKQRNISRFPALHYLASGDQEVGKAAVAAFRKMGIGGSSPTHSGRSAQIYAATFDWLRNHPDFDAETLKASVARLEEWGDRFAKYVTTSSSSMFYCRYPGALAGLTSIGLALHGDSPKADRYIATAYRTMLAYGRAREYQGGARAGGGYDIVHTAPHFAGIVAAFESATDAKLLEYIEKHQSDWVRRQLEWQIWWTMPNGYFVKEGDFWRNRDSHQARMNIDTLAHLLNDGRGRTFADQMHARHGMNDSFGGYAWDFFTFNNPDIKPRPLSELGNATLFGKESHGYTFFRSGWSHEDTVVFFKGGESYDIHGQQTIAHFDVWRGRWLAQRVGPWNNSQSKPRGGDSWWNNTMKFVSEGDDGRHPNTLVQHTMLIDLEDFFQIKKRLGIEAARVTEFEVKDDYARVVTDASAAVRKSCKTWVRELVWLGNRHLLVIDRVETLPKPVKQRWMLYLHGDRRLDGRLASTVMAGNKLYCRSLLPADANMAYVETPAGTRLEVTPPSDDPGKFLYLHVITAGDAKDPEPKTGVERDGDKWTVTVGDLSYTFAE